MGIFVGWIFYSQFSKNSEKTVICRRHLLVFFLFTQVVNHMFWKCTLWARYIRFLFHLLPTHYSIIVFPQSVNKVNQTRKVSSFTVSGTLWRHSIICCIWRSTFTNKRVSCYGKKQNIPTEKALFSSRLSIRAPQLHNYTNSLCLLWFVSKWHHLVINVIKIR